MKKVISEAMRDFINSRKSNKNIECCGKGCDMHDENMRKMKAYNGRREVASIAIGITLVAVAIFIINLI